MVQVVDDANTQQEMEAFYRDRCERAVAGFLRKRLNAFYVPDRKAALAKALELIPPGASIGRGSSVTLEQIGIMPVLRQSGQHEILDPSAKDDRGLPVASGEEEDMDMRRRALLADVFLSGANAITLDGKVVCTDGTGNRVAALIFGPKKVIIVAGVNKIVANLEEALRRIHEVVVPLCHRWDVLKHHAAPEYYLETPCVKSGQCNDCTSIGRGCCYTIIIESAKHPERDVAKRGGKPYPSEYLARTNIIIVGEELGI
ncbi:MAG: lactate utilization protein [Chloroflexi bacterium]|nr:lactate utilization protein [Chloroflexota bacterium]